MYASDEAGKQKANPGNRVYDRVNRHTDQKIEELKEVLRVIQKEVMPEKSLVKKYISISRETFQRETSHITDWWVVTKHSLSNEIC